MCVSVIEVAEAAGEHNDFLVKPCPTLFDIPYLYVHTPKLPTLYAFWFLEKNMFREIWISGTAVMT